MSVSPGTPHRPCPILVINLAGSTARWRKVSAALASCGLAFERHEAADGRILPKEELARLAPWDPAAFFKPLSPGEVGCYLSHVSVAERIVREGWPRTLVLEDDFLLADDFVVRLEDLLALPGPPIDLIKIEGELRGGEPVAVTPGGQKLYRHRRPPSRTAAQLWSLEGARKFLAAAHPFLRPVDVQLKHWWEHGMQIVYVRPPLVLDGDATGATSTIGARPAAGLGGAWRRFRYKASFACASQWHYLRRFGLRSWCRLLVG
jgi:glycosyl transferase family 25